jgi:Zn-dependent protease
MFLLLLPNPLVLVLMLAVYACVILHEFGHVLTAKYFDVPVERITIYPIGGIASIQMGPDEPKKEFFVTLMGPMVNVVLCGLFGVLVLVFASLGWAQAVSFAYTLAYINFILIVFNLAPAYPMDGGRILRSFLGHFMDYRRATWWAVRVGQLTCILLFLFALATRMWLMALIMPLIALMAQNELNVVKLHAEFRRLRQVFLLAAAGKYEEAEAATNFLELESGRKAVLKTLTICKLTGDPDFEEVMEALDQPYPNPERVSNALSELEVACYRKQNKDLDLILTALEERKPLEEVEKIVETLADEDFKAHCKRTLEEVRRRAKS